MPGSYRGANEGFGCCSLSFAVSPDSSTIQNVSIPSTTLTCSLAQPNLSSTVAIASIPISSDGSYTFNGHVHGPNTSGNSRINGIWREDITYANSDTGYYCSSNNNSYYAVFQP